LAWGFLFFGQIWHNHCAKNIQLPESGGFRKCGIAFVFNANCKLGRLALPKLQMNLLKRQPLTKGQL
jgi:hypothetical protein